MAYTFRPPEGISIAEMQPFMDLLPYEQIFNPTDVMNLAYQQLYPEIYRERASALGNLGQNMALSGAYRTGRAATANEDMMNQYLRKLGEQKQEFSDTMNDWMTDWYIDEWKRYEKSPSEYSRPKKKALPSYADYMESAGITPSKTTVPLQETGTYLGSDIGRAMRNIGLLSQAYRPQITPEQMLAQKKADTAGRSVLPVLPATTPSFSDKSGTSSLSSLYTGLPTAKSIFTGF